MCAFVFGGGTNVLIFFGVWGGVWLGYSLFSRWGERARRELLHKHGYD